MKLKNGFGKAFNCSGGSYFVNADFVRGHFFLHDFRFLKQQNKGPFYAYRLQIPKFQILD